MGADYYKLLGIDKDADEAKIKSAYKKMALKWHPDRNGGSEQASQKFKEISEAFEVLSDKNKRAVYDQFGEEGLKNGGPTPGQGGGPGFSGFSGFSGGPSTQSRPGASFTFTSSGPGGFSASDPNTIFEQFFGGSGFGGFSGMGMDNGMRGGMGGGGAGRRRTAPHTHDDDVDMDSPFSSFGGGFGSMPGGMGGGGGGAYRSQPRASSHPTEITKPLKLSLNELYSGTTKRLKVGRRLLNGATEEKVHEIVVQPGWKSGTKVRFPQAGNEMPDGDSQDLVFVVEEKPHQTFERVGNNLVCKISIPLVEALTGGAGRKVVEALDGRKLQITVPPGIVQPGQETIVSGEGMPVRKAGSTREKGDLIVQWKVVCPTSLTPTQREAVKKALS
ncbi:unnamed protein product [Mycena citricolor]|uniref:J domain-containing protein n=1 Tax=Mycena citricolor TaxID=2018698 RepID=A0AAD2H4U0_9AGAR|nr:unnamed protein product [Mycena citricolor]